MTHAEVCPVCRGKGTLLYFENAVAYTDICTACGGSGWVTVCDTCPRYMDDCDGKGFNKRTCPEDELDEAEYRLNKDEGNS
jgi:RecJ-like exonuclease